MHMKVPTSKNLISGIAVQIMKGLSLEQIADGIKRYSGYFCRLVSHRDITSKVIN